MVACGTSQLRAQQTADIIRGQVTGPDKEPVVNVQVTGISFVGGVLRTARTGRNGRFTLVFPNGEGHYWVSFNAIGFQPRRFEVKRIGDEDVLLADTRLSSQPLQTVAVSGTAPRAAPGRADNNQEVSGVDDGVTAVIVPPDQAGNLAAMAAAMPGVQLIPGVDGAPDRFSIFGLAAEQSNITFGGLQQALSRLPRDASASVQLRSGYDVANGGASGATIAVNTLSGTNYITRSFSGLLNAPQAQFSDRAGTVAQYSAVSLGGRLSGPFAMDRDFYNVSFQFDRRAQDLSTIFSNTTEVFERAGVAPDSVARLRTALGALSAPLAARNIGRSERTSGSLLGTFDWASKSPSSGQALTFSVHASFADNGPPAVSTLAAPSALSANRSMSGGTMARHTNYFGSGVLSESVLSISGSQLRNNPLESLPGGRVLVTSLLHSGLITTRSITFGGNANDNRSSSYSLGARNTLSQFSANNRHRFKLFTELRLDHATSTQATNLRGRFTYQSIADVAANRPSSYTRTLNAVEQRASAVVGSLGLGDSWRPSSDLQIQYGVRVDGNQFLTRPAFNPAVQTALGANTSNVPNRVYISPRLGFSRTFGGDAEIYKPFGFFGLGQGRVIRGGIGLFQNTRGPELIAGALANTGLAGAAQQVACVGSATPTIDWNILDDAAFALPRQCADGTRGTVFANDAPSVTLFDNGYVQEKSVRSTLNWSTAILGNQYVFNGTSLLAFNFNQPDYIDINFRAAPRFTLDNEGGRPVFVAPPSIDAASGLIASRDARVAPQFGTVSSLQSALHSRTAQLSMWLSNYTQGPIYWQVNYSYLNVREQYRGFTSTGRSPLEVRSGTGAQPRHDLGLTLRYLVSNKVVLVLDGRVQSGTRFTPVVAGDVNGDGAAAERAFVFDPADAANNPAASGLRNLLENGSEAARRCLRNQRSRIAERNSCSGPWTIANSTLGVAINSLKIGLPRRATLSFTLSNPVGAADLLLHGSNSLHGWGQPQIIDGTLLYVRGFDQRQLRYVYEVNQRFGATSARTAVLRNPSVLTAKVTLDMAPRRDWQDLHQALLRGRGRAGNRMAEGAARQYGAQIFPNPMALMLREGEYLHLSRTQADSLARMSRRYARIVDSLWTPAAKRLAVLPAEFDQSAVEAEMVNARAVAFDYLLAVVPHMQSMLTRGQRVVLSPGISRYFDITLLKTLRQGGLVPFYVFTAP